QEVRDAARVAAHLGIPYYVLDYETRIRAAVIEESAESYLRGETPAPCNRCNERVEFRDLLATQREPGASPVATVHCARPIAGPAQRHRAFHGWPTQSAVYRRRRAVLCAATRSREPTRDRRPEERVMRDARSSRRAQLARSAAAARRNGAGLGQSAFNAAAGF